MEEPRPIELRRARRLDPLRRLSPGGFRTVWLNAVGWGALVGAGLAAGSLSVVAGTPAVVALPAGVVAAWLIALVLDYLRWRNSTTSVGRGDLDASAAQAIVARLRELGVEASYEEQVFGDFEVQRSIRCRNADLRRLDAVMREVLGR